MAAVNEILTQGMTVPPWVVKAFSDCFEKVNRLEVDSWDEAFGKPVPKGRNKEKEKADREFFKKAFHALHAARQAGKPVGRGFYEEIAEDLNSNPRKVEKVLRNGESVRTHGFRKSFQNKTLF